VDVEVRVRRRPRVDGRPDGAGGPSDQADHELARRHPQLLRAGLPGEARRRPRPLLRGLVPGHDAGQLRHPLRRVLRGEPLEHAGLGPRALRRGLREVAHQHDAGRGARPRRRGPRRGGPARVSELPHGRRPAAHRAHLGGPLRIERAPRRRAHGDRRRRLPHQVDDGAARRRGRGLPGGDADVPRRPAGARGGRARRADGVAEGQAPAT
jgi:hypothetical protein